MAAPNPHRLALLVALGALAAVASPATPPADAPELALLSTPVEGDATDLYFQRAGDARLGPAAARFHHA